MGINSFVELKTRQICCYLRAFWNGELPYEELDLFFWDTMEEWSYSKAAHSEKYTQNERVFWHLLHQLHFWSKDDLLNNKTLKEQLTKCVLCLEGKGTCPITCVGIRP